MRQTFVIFLLSCALVNGQHCPNYPRKFAVDNCTACPVYDKTRSDILMANCSGRTSSKSYTCECREFSNSEFSAEALTPTLIYYALNVGHENRCVPAHEIAPVWIVAFGVASVCVGLYATIHAFFIALRLGLWSCQKCTKRTAAALSVGLAILVRTSTTIWMLCSTIGFSIRLGLSYDVLVMLESPFLVLSFVIFCVNMVNTVYSGEDKACRRYVVYSVVPVLGSVFVLLSILELAINLALRLKWDFMRSIINASLTVCMFSMIILVTIEHIKMRKIVREYEISGHTPSIVVKMEDLCSATCRYFYPSMVVAFTAIVLSQTKGCAWNLSPTFAIGIVEPLSKLCALISYMLWVCFLEGKPIPTFPWWLVRRDQKHNTSTILQSPISGLQFSSTLGSALSLLVKHGLETKKREESPVEDAIESLLSTDALKVASASDMDLLGCIEHFLDRCVDETGKIAKRFAEMPVGRLLRGGCTQHTVTSKDIKTLRSTTENCLKWAKDPSRKPIYDTSIDEAAAIMLYTQATCVYPLLNKTLRDDRHTEELKAFLPYMKLLLKGLNKLPLVRFNVHRALRVDVHEQYNKLQGKVFRWWAFSSTTLKKKTADIMLGEEGDRTMFSIDVVGVDIAAFSAYPQEAEVLMLPGTCLVVDPGVMVEPNYWKFEASVWKAIQQQRHQTHDESKKHIHDTEGSPKSVDGWNDSGDSMTRFQNTDLPHPGWKAVISTQEALPLVSDTTTETSLIVDPPLPVTAEHSCVRTSDTSTETSSMIELSQATAGVTEGPMEKPPNLRFDDFS